MDKDFNEFWDRYQPDEIRFPNRRAATFRAWNERSPATRQAMLEQVRSKGTPKWKNPYFFVLDFPEPEPEFLRGDEPGPIVQVRYNDRFKLCRPETAKLFNLTITNKNWK